jgi:hypothetical protein
VSNKPRPLGRKAQGNITDVDSILAHAVRQLDHISRNDQSMLRAEIDLIVTRAQRDITEARRIIAETLSIRE